MKTEASIGFSGAADHHREEKTSKSRRASLSSFSLYLQLTAQRIMFLNGLNIAKKPLLNLKNLLTSALVIQPLDWSLPFEIMCDASNYVVGAVLG
jgi:hypothetical protein